MVDFNRYEYFGGGTHLQHSLANIDLKQDQIYYTNHTFSLENQLDFMFDFDQNDENHWNVLASTADFNYGWMVWRNVTNYLSLNNYTNSCFKSNNFSSLYSLDHSIKYPTNIFFELTFRDKSKVSSTYARGVKSCVALFPLVIENTDDDRNNSFFGIIIDNGRSGEDDTTSYISNVYAVSYNGSESNYTILDRGDTNSKCRLSYSNLAQLGRYNSYTLGVWLMYDGIGTFTYEIWNNPVSKISSGTFELDMSKFNHTKDSITSWFRVDRVNWYNMDTGEELDTSMADNPFCKVSFNYGQNRWNTSFYNKYNITYI